MLRPRLSAGVEVAGGVVRIALLSLKPVPTVQRLLEIPLGPGDELALGRIVARGLAEAGARGANVHVAFSIPGAPQAKLLVAPKLRRAELRQVAMRELRRDAQMDPGKLYFEIERLGLQQSEGGARAHRYVVASLAQPQLEEVAQALQSGRFIARSATSSVMAVMRASSAMNLRKGSITAVAHLDTKRSSLVILEDGVPRFFRDFPTDQARVPDEEVLSHAIARELDLSLVYFAQQHRPRQVDAVMVVGAAAYADRVRQFLQANAAYEVVRFAPGPGLAVAPGLNKPLEPFAAAIGAALGADAPSVPNVLPQEMRGQPERLAAIVTASLVILLTIGGILQLRAGHTQRLEAEEQRYQKATQELASLEPRVQNAARIGVAVTRAETWGTHFDEVTQHHRRLGHFLSELAGVVPERGSLGVLTLAKGGESESGTARGRPAAPTPAVRTTKPKPTHKVKLIGTIRGNTLDSVQQELRLFAQEAEKLTAVRKVDLSPIARTMQHGQREVEVPFTIDLLVENRFP